MREKIKEEIFYVPDVQMYFHEDDMDLPKKFDSVKEIFELQTKLVNRENNLCKKQEEKAQVLTMGYLKKLEVLLEKYNSMTQNIEDLRIKKNVYSDLKQAEELAMVNRQKYLNESIKLFSEKEKELQDKYKRYKDKVEELENI